MSEEAIINILRERLGDRLESFLIPPPVFRAMQGEFVSMDLEAGSLKAKFPILKKYLNPYGVVQGGMVAAAVDNTLGPLSMLVAPPNVTRRLEMKYSRSVTPAIKYILIEGYFQGREDRVLSFSAEVRDPATVLLARARATHWIIDFPKE
jgi:acyl-coenzyme A thioesterase PaaI-like protein